MSGGAGTTADAAFGGAGPPLSPTKSDESGSTISDEMIPPGHQGDSTLAAGTTSQELTDEDLWERTRGQRIILTLSDVGGHPFYGAIWPSAIAAADAFVLVYDVGNKQSFESVFSFYKQIHETKCARPGTLPIMLLGNMVDNVTSDPLLVTLDKRLRQVTRDMGESMAKLLNVAFNETTTMAPKSVTHCFHQLLDIAQVGARAYMAAGRIVSSAHKPPPPSLFCLRRPSESSSSTSAPASSTCGSNDRPPRTPVSATSPALSVNTQIHHQHYQQPRTPKAYSAPVATTSIPISSPTTATTTQRHSNSTTRSEGSAHSVGKYPGHLVIANPSSRSSATSSSDGTNLINSTSNTLLVDLPTARPDSIRFRRDTIFRAWKNFQTEKDDDKEGDRHGGKPGDGPGRRIKEETETGDAGQDGRDRLASMVWSTGSSSSRPRSPQHHHHYHHQQQQSHHPATSPTTIGGADKFGSFVSRSTAVTVTPLPTSTKMNTHDDEEDGDMSPICVTSPPLPAQPSTTTTTNGTAPVDPTLRRYRSMDILPQPPPPPPSRSRQPSLKRSQHDLETLLEELATFGFDQSDESDDSDAVDASEASDDDDDEDGDGDAGKRRRRKERMEREHEKARHRPPQFGITRSRSLGNLGWSFDHGDHDEEHVVVVGGVGGVQVGEGEGEGPPPPDDDVVPCDEKGWTRVSLEGCVGLVVNLDASQGGDGTEAGVDAAVERRDDAVGGMVG
ncbi:hypothetical protein HKX48_000557 [Thoreauomyces humboldtii]|nr:hypothetical protein HKX48_000557 [Thoreauomyces humboldtii]